MVNKVKDLEDLKNRLVADVLNIDSKMLDLGKQIEDLRSKKHKSGTIREENMQNQIRRLDAQADKEIEILSVIMGLEKEQVEDYIIALEKNAKNS